jgi:hypothetical protein
VLGDGLSPFGWKSSGAQRAIEWKEERLLDAETSA